MHRLFQRCFGRARGRDGLPKALEVDEVWLFPCWRTAPALSAQALLWLVPGMLSWAECASGDRRAVFGLLGSDQSLWLRSGWQGNMIWPFLGGAGMSEYYMLIELQQSCAFPFHTVCLQQADSSLASPCWGVEDGESQCVPTNLPSFHICLLGCLVSWYNHNNARITP